MKPIFHLTSLIILLVFSTGWCKFTIETLVQPLFLIQERGDFAKDGRAKFSIRRARFGLNHTSKVKDIQFKSKISFDLSEGVNYPKRQYGEKDHEFTERVFESAFSQILKNAYIDMTFFKQFSVRGGKHSLPLEGSMGMSSTDIPVLYRSFTVDHLKNDLLGEGNQIGITFTEEFPFKNDIIEDITISAGLYNYVHNRAKGFDLMRSFLSLGAFNVKADFFKDLEISYGLLSVRPTITMANDVVTTKHALLHDISVHYTPKKWYNGLLEVFIGVDTTTAQDFRDIIGKEYETNIAYSIYSTHTGIFPLSKKIDLYTTVGFEFINGIGFKNSQLTESQTRDFFYALTGDIQLRIGKRMTFEMAYDTRFDNNFTSVNEQRFGVQFSYNNEITLKKSK